MFAVNVPWRALLTVGFVALLSGCTEPVSASYNWAGYVATGHRFTSVGATWVQPEVTPSPSRGQTSTSFWVGLGETRRSHIEQIGTEGFNHRGTVGYCAWYELYPQGLVTIRGLSIRPGNLVSATVTSDGRGVVILKLIDRSTHASFSTILTDNKATLQSAEVVVEDPSTTSDLANFGRVRFVDCAIDGRPLCASHATCTDLVSHSGAMWAHPSVLNSSGTRFTIVPGSSQPLVCRLP
jgi:hypothetical protein